MAIKKKEEERMGGWKSRGLKVSAGEPTRHYYGNYWERRRLNEN